MGLFKILLIWSFVCCNCGIYIHCNQRVVKSNSRFRKRVFPTPPICVQIFVVFSHSRSFITFRKLRYFKSLWIKCDWKIDKEKTYQKESVLLKLNSNKAHKILKWKTELSFKETLVYTLNWYKSYYLNESKIITFEQINRYKKNLKKIK